MSQTRTRLCLVTPQHPSYSMGGAEFQIECMLERLVELGRYDIAYVARGVDPEFRPSGYRIARIGTDPRPPRFGYSMDAVPLYRALSAFRPQIIYQRVACGYSGIAAFYARRHGARMIWHVAHDTDVTGTPLAPGRNPVRRHLESASIGYMIRNVDQVVAQTEWQRRQLQSNYGIDAAVIPNFHPEPREGLEKGAPVTVLWVANFKHWKRPELFLDLASGLSDLAGVRFVIVGAQAGGSGAVDWNAALLKRIATLPNVDYLGPKSQVEINNLLARAHVFVNTSVSEGFPNTFIQAWMRAVPVVSLNVDPDGVLEREAVGFHTRTTAALESSVRRLIEMPALRAEYGARARRYALLKHSLRNVEQLIGLIGTQPDGPEHNGAVHAGPGVSSD